MCSAHLHAASRELPTLIAGRYRFTAALGRGGAAQLYRVVDLARGCTLALKQLHHSAHPKLRELFELEYQTLASLNHARTPQVFDFGNDLGGVFYTMELLEGSDLSALAPLPWRSVVDHLRDASQALGVLHARKLIHRDVSPRNLWRTPDGRVKLIDFGAIAPFGPSAQVVGTPPLVPPEALERRPLDQRTDLYALGGVAYFLLTGRHAYPAPTLEGLPELWRSTLPVPSTLTTQQPASALDPMPKELDALVLELLRGEALLRPSSTADVIDRLDSICGAARAPDREAAHARLANVEYVGRTRQSRRLSRCLALAVRGRGQVCVIEAVPGGGRSRALKELELAARVGGANVLQVNAAGQDALYGVAGALALALLDADPERAKNAARPYASLLAHLSTSVRDRLDAVAEPLPEAVDELRVRVQDALRDWILAVAAERSLVVLVDGLELADEASAACLLGLALGLSGAKLLLSCALLRERERRPALRELVKLAHRVSLPPLTAADMQTLLQSVFGSAEHLSRLSGRLHELTRGNPGYALELCRQLVERGEIHYESGSWVLPRELDLRSLSTSFEQALSARLSRVSPPGRELARLLSVHAGPLAPGLCRVLATSQGADLLPHLGELLGAEILVALGPRYVFVHEQLRRTCLDELVPEVLQRARLALAEYLSSSPDAGAVGRLQAGVHWMAAGDARGRPMVVRACLQLTSHEADKLARAAPMIEAALQQLRARDSSKYEQIALLHALVLGGYEGERRYLLHYADDAVRTLDALLELPRARRLRRLVGGKLALSAALAAAAVGFLRRRKDPCVPSFVDAMQMLFVVVSCATGACSTCMDPSGATRFADTLQPFAALGPNHLGGFMYDFCQSLAASTRDHQYLSLERSRSLLARIDTTDVLASMSDAARKRVRGGVLLGIAASESLRDGRAAIDAAAALDANGLQLDQVGADQIRMVYHGSRGEMAACEQFRARVERHAIARGGTWQSETWITGCASAVAWSLHDALGMKSASEQMRRLSESIPSLVVHARYMRGAYLLLRGRCAEAVPWLEDCLGEPPASRPAWGRSHGVLARAYNRLGDHTRAQAACRRVIDHYTQADFEYVHLNLVVQTEDAIAQAGLGRLSEARERLARLHTVLGGSDNPLVRGQLFETGLEIALITRDLPAAREQLAQLDAVYRPLSLPSLAQYCERMAARVDQLASGPRADTGRSVSRPVAAAAVSGARTWSREMLSAGERLPLAQRAERALRLLAQSSQASAGVLYFADTPATPRVGASLSGAAPSALVERWVRERFALELEDAGTLFETEVDPTHTPWDALKGDGCEHRMFVLTAGDGALVAIAVLERADAAPTQCPAAQLRALAHDLSDALTEERSAHASVVCVQRAD